MCFNTLVACDFIKVTLNYGYKGTFTNIFYTRQRKVTAGFFKWESVSYGCTPYATKDKDEFFDNYFRVSRIFAVIACAISFIGFASLAITPCVAFSRRAWTIVTMIHIFGAFIGPMCFLILASKLCHSAGSHSSCEIGPGGLYAIASSIFSLTSVMSIKFFVDLKPIFWRYLTTDSKNRTQASPFLIPSDGDNNRKEKQINVNPNIKVPSDKTPIDVEEQSLGRQSTCTTVPLDLEYNALMVDSSSENSSEDFELPESSSRSGCISPTASDEINIKTDFTNQDVSDLTDTSFQLSIISSMDGDEINLKT